MQIAFSVPADVEVKWNEQRRELRVSPQFYRPRQKREIIYLRVVGESGREVRYALTAHGGSGKLMCEHRRPVVAAAFDLPDAPDNGVQTGTTDDE